MKFEPVAGAMLVGRYQLLHPLGEGGVGVVWAAKQVTTNKPVAIKLLKDESRSEGARFVREAKIVSGLSHRNIVQVFDFWDGTDGSPIFMVMERLEGESLAQRLHNTGRLTQEAMAEIVLPIVSALQAAHAAGIIHRDLKPDNVFLSTNDGGREVKVLDFGIAKPVTPEAGAAHMTQTGTVLGTPRYMAPEQVYGDPHIDARADVWSLGVLMYECLVGIPPFGGDNYGQLFREITEKKRISARAAVPETPAALDALIMRMLAHDRSDRPSLADVARVLRGGEMSAAPLAVTELALPMARRSPLGKIVVGLVALGALFGVVDWRIRSQRAAQVAQNNVRPPVPSAASVSSVEIQPVTPDALPERAADAGRPTRPGKKPVRPTPSVAPSVPPSADPLDKGRF